MFDYYETTGRDIMLASQTIDYLEECEKVIKRLYNDFSINNVKLIIRTDYNGGIEYEIQFPTLPDYILDFQLFTNKADCYHFLYEYERSMIEHRKEKVGELREKKEELLAQIYELEVKIKELEEM